MFVTKQIGGSAAVLHIFLILTRAQQEILKTCPLEANQSINQQFHIVHTYESHPTKGEPCNYSMKAAVP